jgi:uncharacterized protein
MSGHPELSTRLNEVPLFPLPNVVLFPRAILPLHVFEERYKKMTYDALQGDRLIAMALLKPGWERDYYQMPQIEPVVCLGTILTHEDLPDGKYNFLLQGLVRAKVVSETRRRTYRVADLDPLDEIPAMEIDLTAERQCMVNLFSQGLLAEGVGAPFRKLLASPLPTADVVDLACFNFLEDVELKQSLLAELDVRRRVRRAVNALEALQPVMNFSSVRALQDPGMN